MLSQNKYTTRDYWKFQVERFFKNILLSVLKANGKIVTSSISRFKKTFILDLSL